MTKLSPAAQAILDAAKLPSKCYARSIAAAILRAAANEAKALEVCVGPGFFKIDEFIAVRDLLAIADELDAQP